MSKTKIPVIFKDPSCTPDTGAIIKMLDGEQVDHETFSSESKVIAIGNYLPSSNGLYGFSSDKEFRNWAEWHPISAKVNQTYRLIEKAHNYEYNLTKELEEAIDEYEDNKSKQIDKMIDRTELEIRSLEAFLKLEGILDPPIAPKLIRSLMLFQDKDYKGNYVWASGFRPFLGKKFNNQTTSLRARGVNLICDKTWFRGKKMWVIAHPTMGIPDLRPYGWNDKISSTISV